jgi:solute carrier family 10 (sodium/bile acid cotransporter), member 7
MVSIAGGNISSAIFNASVSSLIGVFITPVWMGLFLTSTTSSYDLLPVITKLIFQVLLPVVGGIALHAKFGAFALKYPLFNEKIGDDLLSHILLQYHQR